jgi:hypothetical protein
MLSRLSFFVVDFRRRSSSSGTGRPASPRLATLSRSGIHSFLHVSPPVSNHHARRLNGGPGCSSLDGFLEENGPISWQPGTSGPVANPNAWTTVSDVVYIEQPVGTGFTKGTPNITNESQLAQQFYGFIEQFYSVFPELAAKVRL